jgi:hypothetical protein
MITTPRVQKVWVYVAPSPKAHEQGKFKLALRPFRYRSRPVNQKPFLFVTERSFTSENRAMQEAGWLFGIVEWERVGRHLKAPVELVCKAP